MKLRLIRPHQLALALVILLTAKAVHALPILPCAPTSLTDYMQPGFACTISGSQWRFSEFGIIDLRPSTAIDTDEIMVIPFGGTQVAGLRFNLSDSVNTVELGEVSDLEITYSLLASRPVTGVALEVVNAFAGPPVSAPHSPPIPARTTAQLHYCLGGFFTSHAFSCTSTSGRLDIEGYGEPPAQSVKSAQIPGTAFIDVITLPHMYGGQEFPGRARLDAIINRFRVVPEPATLALFGLGLVGLGFVRRRSAR